jgi:hypothetical protein
MLETRLYRLAIFTIFLDDAHADAHANPISFYSDLYLSVVWFCNSNPIVFLSRTIKTAPESFDARPSRRPSQLFFCE